MTPREIEEYRALRATIRERGTARMWIFAAGMGLWAGGVLVVACLIALPVATLVPLLVLAAVFEAVYAMHVGVERVGRYIQVFYEGADQGATRRWEQAAMAFGRLYPGRGTDPLFTTFFVLATVCNMVPAMLAGAVAVEWLVVGLLHLLFIVRIGVAKRHAGRQRAMDLDAFEKIRASPAQS